MLRIGEFSRVCRVPSKTLRYYDEIGLFRPARVDTSTGYRLYALDQLPTLNRILAMRDLGFSLEQVAALVDAPASSAAMIREMLVAKRAELHARIAEEQGRLARVEARLRLIEQEEQTMPADVIVKDVPPRTVATARETVGDISEIGNRLRFLFEHVAHAVHTHGWRVTGPPIALYHNPEYTERDLDTEAGLLVDAPTTGNTPPPPNTPVAVRTLPGGTVASLVFRGPYDQVSVAYAALGAWIGANGYRITGPVCEMYLSMPDATSREAVTELQWFVQKD